MVLNESRYANEGEVGMMSKDLWGRLAETYEVDHTLISGADLVSAIQSELRGAVPAGEVVELGCGTGLYTRAYAPSAALVTATDKSAPMLRRAERSLADLPNVIVKFADAMATGLPGESADAVVAVNLLHIVPDAAGVLAEIRRLLRPGGTAILVDATSEKLTAKQMLISMWRIVRRWGLIREKGQQDLTQAGLESLTREAGFDGIQGRLLTGSSMNAALVRAVKPGGRTAA